MSSDSVPVPVAVVTKSSAEGADQTAEIDRLTRELEEARAQIARLEELAHEDDLTGALNRRGFQRELARAIAHARRYGGSLGLIMADLDGLKRVNDQHGHAAGDDLIVAVAKALKGQIRASDSIARIGGDEFAILLWNIDETQARLKAARLQTAADLQSGLPSDVAEQSGLSVGVAVLQSSDTGESLVVRADADLYFDKVRRGRVPR